MEVRELNVETGEVVTRQMTEEEQAEYNARILTDAEKLQRWRESCEVTSEKFKLALADDGIYPTVITALESATLRMQIRFAEASSFKRLDADLVNFAKTTLNMADSEIDALFKSAEIQ